MCICVWKILQLQDEVKEQEIIKERKNHLYENEDGEILLIQKNCGLLWNRITLPGILCGFLHGYFNAFFMVF